jgi:transcription initiation factor TFIIB
MTFLRDLSDRLNIIESTFNKALEITKKVEDSGLGKGQKINVKCAVIMYIACKLTNHPKEIKDIMKATSSDNKEIARCYKKIKECMPGAQLGQTSSKYCEDACKKMLLENEVTEVCKATADQISKLEILTGKKPATIAGVAIWMILKRSPKYSARYNPFEISKVLCVGDVAIKNAYREVEDLENEILPIGFQQKLHGYY